MMVQRRGEVGKGLCDHFHAFSVLLKIDTATYHRSEKHVIKVLAINGTLVDLLRRLAVSIIANRTGFFPAQVKQTIGFIWASPLLSTQTLGSRM